MEAIHVGGRNVCVSHCSDDLCDKVSTARRTLDEENYKQGEKAVKIMSVPVYTMRPVQRPMSVYRPT